MVYRMPGDYAQALDALRHEYQLIGQHGQDPMQLAVNLYERTMIALLMGHLPKAASLAQEAMTFAHRAQDPMTLGCVYRVAGEVVLAQKQGVKATEAFQQAMAFFQDAGDDIAAGEVRVLLDDASGLSQTDGK